MEQNIITHNSQEILSNLASQGLDRKIIKNGIIDVKRYKCCLDRELNVIEKMGLSVCFLDIANSIQYAKAKNIPIGPGRDGTANSLLAWCLNITEVDPIRFDLIFEKSFNHRCTYTPQISIEIDPRYQNEIIQHFIKNSLSYDSKQIKIEFIEMPQLTYIHNIEKIIRKKIPEFCIQKIPLDNIKTFSMLLQRNAEEFFQELFQFESFDIKLFQQIKPCTIEDFAAVIALDRPYLKELKSKFLKNRVLDSPFNEIPIVNNILKNTHGCILYQEQIVKLLHTLAGYPLESADLIRRAIAKKHWNDIEKARESFLYGSNECQGVLAKGFSKKEAEQIFREIETSAGFAFSKAHAVARSMLWYQSAYLKCNFPEEYS